MKNGLMLSLTKHEASRGRKTTNGEVATGEGHAEPQRKAPRGVGGLPLQRLGEGLNWPVGALARMFELALVAGLPAAGLWWLLPPWWHVFFTATLVVGLYAAAYLGLAHLVRMPEIEVWLGRLRRRRRG